ncbi:HAAS signaling domain-containing protein [Pseudactinotalea sp.]|uniref:HAAS signaling domain-containing protein n=1 Tax=Pseudactinotalea sp. TaxID=1926260 RepID=UPI003B39FBF3
MSTLPLTDRLRRWSYLQDVELWLDPMPGHRRREVIRELRTNLADAAADVGMTNAIEDLGKPRDLAREFVKAEPRRRPSWSLGVIGAGAVLLVAMLAGLAYAFGMSDSLLDTGGGSAEGAFLGIRVLAVGTESELSWTWSGWSWPITIVAVIAFLVASSAWRLLRR